MKRFIKLTILSAIVFFAAADSQAVIFGIRFSDITQEPLPGIADTGAKGRFGTYLGFREKNSLFLVGLDYDRHKFERGDTSLYARRMVVNLGYRFHLLTAEKAEAMDFMPFVALHLFKGFSKVSADTTVMSTADVNYYKDLYNNVGGWLSLGAEYYFAPAFSFGGETGIRYTRVRSKAYGDEIKIGEYTTFVALIMTFYW
jgi:hypothetical protein